MMWPFGKKKEEDPYRFKVDIKPFDYQRVAKKPEEVVHVRSYALSTALTVFSPQIASTNNPRWHFSDSF